jgi:hypothetical protein
VLGDRVRLRSGRGIVSELNRAEVVAIVWKQVSDAEIDGAAAAYAKRAAGLKTDSAAGQFALGSWCAENGLAAEARTHLRAAERLDAAAYAGKARPIIEKLDGEEESRAVKAMLGAFAVCERSGIEAGAAALRAVRAAFPDSQIVLRAELQRDLVKRHFPVLLRGGIDSLDSVLRQAEDQAAVRCRDCSGSGKMPCAFCRGTGAGACPECAGSGRRSCPVCEGRGRITCAQCFGRGKTSKNVIGYGEQSCPACRGGGEVICDVCAGAGQLQCKACGGKATVAGGCAKCRGQGQLSCVRCSGSGLEPVTALRWDPPPVRLAGMVSVIGPGARFKAWQGVAAGGAVTVLPENVLWRGALSGNISNAGIKDMQVLAVSLDNRKGTRMLTFRSGGRSLRAVRSGAGQSESGDLSMALIEKQDGRGPNDVGRAAADADCLPGAHIGVLAAFKQPFNLEEVEVFYWVQDGLEPVKLDQIWLTADEVSALRKSLRKNE